MKKLLAILLAGLMMISIAACSDKNNGKENDDDKYRDTTVIVDSLTQGTDTFRFENVDSETVIVVDFSTTLDKAHEVKIPAYLMVPGNEREQEPDKYLRVVGVGKEAFLNSSSISSLVFPTEADYKEHNAEFDMSEHSFVIGDYAFRECVALKSLDLPAYVTEIGVGSFYGCIALGDVNFAEGSRLKSIGDYAFMNCIALQSITFPATLESIGAASFFECVGLESVVINEGTLTVGAQAFQKCSALAELKLPASLESIGKYAFHTCESLYKEGLSYAGDAAAINAYISSLGLKERPEEAPVVPETPAE
jgi:hypothetical protein